MKSTIRKILREQFDQYVEKNQTYTKILNDLLKNFNSGTVEYVKGMDGDFDLYTKTVEFATTIVSNYLEKTYGLVSPEENDLRNSLLSDWIRATYKDGNGALPGDTIEMVEMFDDPNGIEPGTRGVVDDVASFEFGGNWEEHIEVNWENGRTLKVMLPYDKIKIVDKTLNEETEYPEEWSPQRVDKQEKVYDYAVKDIIDSIEITPENIVYEHINAVLDDPYMDDVVDEIMNNWREMDARGWRVSDGEEGTSDGMVFSKKSNPSNYMGQWDAREEIAKEVMAELVESGKFSRLTPEENEFFMAPDGRPYEGWEALYNDYNVKIIDGRLKFPLWYDPFKDFYYPFGIELRTMEGALSNYLKEAYGLLRDESSMLLGRIKKGIRDRFKEEGINVNYGTPYGGALLSEGVIDDFVDFTKDELGLDDDFSVELEDNGDNLETLASYGIEDNKVRVLSKNRALPDIIRSIAHELVHHKQNQEGELTGDKEEGDDGAPLENEANAKAGEIVRKFGKIYPADIYDL
jgi:hypothetical protein